MDTEVDIDGLGGTIARALELADQGGRELGARDGDRLLRFDDEPGTLIDRKLPARVSIVTQRLV